MPQNRTRRNFFSSFFSWITTSFTLILNSIIGEEVIEETRVDAQTTNKTKGDSSPQPVPTIEPKLVNPSKSKQTPAPADVFNDLNKLADILKNKKTGAGKYLLSNRKKIEALIRAGKPVPLKKLIVQLQSILKQDNSKEITECVTELKLLSEKSKTLLTSSKATPLPLSQDPSQKVVLETNVNQSSSENIAIESFTLKSEDFGYKKPTIYERLESLNTSLKALNDLIPEASNKKGKGKKGYSPQQVLRNRKSDIQKEIETLKTSIVEENRLIANGDSNSRLGTGTLYEVLPEGNKFEHSKKKLNKSIGFEGLEGENGKAIEKAYYGPAVYEYEQEERPKHTRKDYDYEFQKQQYYPTNMKGTSKGENDGTPKVYPPEPTPKVNNAAGKRRVRFSAEPL